MCSNRIGMRGANSGGRTFVRVLGGILVATGLVSACADSTAVEGNGSVRFVVGGLEPSATSGGRVSTVAKRPASYRPPRKKHHRRVKKTTPREPRGKPIRISGSGVKTRVLLEHLDDPAGYVPIDISRSALVASSPCAGAYKRAGGLSCMLRRCCTSRR